MNELKKFSCSLFVFTLVFSLVLYFKLNHRLAIIFFTVFFALALLTLVNETFAQKFKCFLTKIGNFLGDKITVVVLFLIFILAIIPTKIVMVLCKRDRLRLKNKKEESYWIEYDNQNKDWDLQY